MAQVSPEAREKAKRVTYGVIYGLTPWGLAQGAGALGISVAAAQARRGSGLGWRAAGGGALCSIDPALCMHNATHLSSAATCSSCLAWSTAPSLEQELIASFLGHFRGVAAFIESTKAAARQQVGPLDASGMSAGTCTAAFGCGAQVSSLARCSSAALHSLSEAVAARLPCMRRRATCRRWRGGSGPSRASNQAKSGARLALHVWSCLKLVAGRRLALIRTMPHPTPATTLSPLRPPPLRSVRAEAERKAVNSTVQGSAADIMKVRRPAPLLLYFP